MLASGLLASLLVLQEPRYTLTLTGAADPKLKADVVAHVDAGMARVEKFFGRKFPKAFSVEVYANRAALDAMFKKRWNAPPSEKWMVAAGVAEHLFLLSPRVWKSEAVEHDGGDSAHVQEIVTHELTHVFHGQHSPRHEFDGMERMAWFIEGLATYVAGQLEGRRLTARQAIEAGQTPTSLEKAWQGQYRYSVAGSIVRYVDVKFGRAKLIDLLKSTSTVEALKTIGVTEQKLLKDWKTYEMR